MVWNPCFLSGGKRISKIHRNLVQNIICCIIFHISDAFLDLFSNTSGQVTEFSCVQIPNSSTASIMYMCLCSY